MSDEPENLPDVSHPVLLPGVGAVRAHGDGLHAWIARMEYVNDGGLVFEQGRKTEVSVVHHGACRAEDAVCGHLLHGAQSGDGHLVVRVALTTDVHWVSEGYGYAVPEYEPATLRCGVCGILHRRRSSPCECLSSSPVWIIDQVQVISLRIYRQRRDEYVGLERDRLYRKMFAPVLPNAPGFRPKAQ